MRRKMVSCMSFLVMVVSFGLSGGSAFAQGDLYPVDLDLSRDTDEPSPEFTAYIEYAQTAITAMRVNCSGLKIDSDNLILFRSAYAHLKKEDLNSYVDYVFGVVTRACAAIQLKDSGLDLVKAITLTVPGTIGRRFGWNTDPVEIESYGFGNNFELVLRPFVKNEETDTYDPAMPGTNWYFGTSFFGFSYRNLDGLVSDELTAFKEQLARDEQEKRDTVRPVD